MSTSDAAISAIVLDRASDTALHVQLTGQLRSLILSGRIAPGAKLPSSRALAVELGVSRITVTSSMDQLAAEGYAQGAHGRGMFVVAVLPEKVLMAPAAKTEAMPKPLQREMRTSVPFKPAAIDARLFPHKEWARLLDRSWQSQSVWGQFSPAGFGPLREAVAQHLFEWRGLACQPEDIIVTAGGADAIQLLIRAEQLAGKTVVLEDPGYPLFVDELAHHGVKTVFAPLDEYGLQLDGVMTADIAIVTPSRQYPTGITMPVTRRLELLAWANETGALIVEDDFDSEYRYRGTPLPTMTGLASADRVIYMGSFSKVFSPLLRLGYLVLPPDRTDIYMRVLEDRGTIASAMPQPALARFMQSGGFAKHIRRMRRTYAARQQALIEAVDYHLNGLLEVEPEAGGMHLIAKLSDELAKRMSDRDISKVAQQAGLTLPALSTFSQTGAGRQGLLMGYSGFSEEELEAGCRKLAEVLQA